MKWCSIALTLGTLIMFCIIIPSSGISACFKEPPPIIVDTSQQTRLSISDQALSGVTRKYRKLQKLIQQRTESMLSRMESRETNLQVKVAGKDSATAATLFSGVDQKYHSLQNNILTPVIQERVLGSRWIVNLMMILELITKF